MSRNSILALCLSITAAIIALPSAFIAAVERTAAFVFSLLPTLAGNPAFAVDGPTLAFDAPGASLDPALQNSMRHEAGMRRLT